MLQLDCTGSGGRLGHSYEVWDLKVLCVAAPSQLCAREAAKFNRALSGGKISIRHTVL